MGLLLVFILAGIVASTVETLRVRGEARWSASAELLVPEQWIRIVRHTPNGDKSIDPSILADEILNGGPAVRPAMPPDAPVGSPASHSPGGPLVGPEREMVRRGLHVTVDRSGEGAVRIGVRLTVPNQDRAVRQVNDLIAAYATQLRLGMAREVLRRTAELGAIEDRVEGELHQVRPQLDVIVDRAVSKTAMLVPAVQQVAASPSNKSQAADSPFVEEPAAAPAGRSEADLERTEITRQLEGLRRRRERLLVERTGVHPEVRQLDAQIQEAERQLAAMPVADSPKAPPAAPETARPMPEMPSAPPRAERASDRPSPNPAQSAELFQAIQVLQGRIDSVARDLKQARAQKIPGATSLLRGDDLGIRWAERAERIAAQVDMKSLLLVALTAGLVATAGTGMVWMGLSIDQPFGTSHNVERGLKLPIIGTIAVEQPLREDAANRVIRSRWKWPCIVGGGAVLGAYVAFLVQPFLAG